MKLRSSLSLMLLLLGFAGCNYSVAEHRPVLASSEQSAPTAPSGTVSPEPAKDDTGDEVIAPANEGTPDTGSTPTPPTPTTPTDPAGTTPPPPACTPKVCGPTPDGDMCGVQDNGCGEPLDCGDCASGETCGGGGVTNVCGTAATPPKPPHVFPHFPISDLPLVNVMPDAPMSPADVDAIDNLKISIMVPNFTDADAKHVGLIFCPTADFQGPDCIKTRLETAKTQFIYRSVTNSFYLLREGSMSPEAAAVIDEGRMGELHLSNFRYFRFYALGEGGDNSLLIGGVELSAKPKGSSEWVTVYRNPCVNRMVYKVESGWSTWGGPGIAPHSDHSLRDDQAVCVFMKTAAHKDAGTDDTVSIEVPLSQALGVEADHWLNGFDDADSMALHYDGDRGDVVKADLKWNEYEDFADGGETSYGFTIFHSEGRLQGYYRLKTNGDDVLDFTKVEVYQFNPGDPAFLLSQKVLGKVYNEDEHLGSLSKDGDEGTQTWPFQFDKLSETTSDQFKIMGWNTTATAFGRK